MQVILRQNIDKLGKIGDIVNVKDGYARNYLLPQNMAMLAGDGAVKAIEREKIAYERKQEAFKQELAKMVNDMQTKSYTITKKVGEEDKLYGSVTTADIAEVLKQEGFDIDKRKIVLEENISALGVYPVHVKLGLDIEAEIKVWVVKE